MSASERLRELDGALHFDAPTDRATFVKGRDAEHAILRALPLIADCIEAAEAQDALTPASELHEYAAVNRKIAVALTALREHLEAADAH